MGDFAVKEKFEMPNPNCLFVFYSQRIATIVSTVTILTHMHAFLLGFLHSSPCLSVPYTAPPLYCEYALCISVRTGSVVYFHYWFKTTAQACRNECLMQQKKYRYSTKCEDEIHFSACVSLIMTAQFEEGQWSTYELENLLKMCFSNQIMSNNISNVALILSLTT